MVITDIRIHSVRVLAIIAFYWTVSISLVFVNKKLLFTNDTKRDVALFICWYQTLSGTIMMAVFLRLYRRVVIKPSLVSHPNIVTLSSLFVCGLILNMQMLKYIGVAFYQVARSTTLIFVVIFSYVILRKLVTFKSSLCCGLVVIGFFIGADQEALSSGFSFTGIVYGIAASLIIGLTSVVMKISQKIARDSVELTFYYNTASCVILTVLMVSTKQFSLLLEHVVRLEVSVWLWLTYSGLLSIGMGWASTLQIRYTSPMTHHVSISAKSALQTIIAVAFYQEYKGTLWWFGTLLTIVGTALYAVTKIQEDQGSANLIDKNIEINVSFPITGEKFNGSGHISPIADKF